MDISELRTKYWKKVCETDSNWEVFCKFPNDTTWVNYKKSKDEENQLLAQFPEDERLKIIQDD